MPISPWPINFYTNGESAGQVVTWTIDDRFSNRCEYCGDVFELDAAGGASVDDLIDDIDAVLDSYRESRDGLRG